MVLDYKDVSFSFGSRRKKRLTRRIIIILASLLIIFIYYSIKSLITYSRLENLQALLLQNEPARVSRSLENMSAAFFYPDTKKELKALAHLFANDIPQAERLFAKLHDSSTKIAFKKFLDYFLDKASYKELKIYTDFLEKKGKGAGIRYYRILVETAFFNYKQSRDLVTHLPAEEQAKYKKELKIIEQVNNGLATGKIPYIFDVNGKPLAAYDIVNKRTWPLTAGFDFSPFTADLGSSLKFYKLTIDANIQEKLQRLFRDYYGSFLLLDLSDGSIAAAYSKPANKKEGNTVFSAEYEPASIIKILTLFTYLKNGGAEIFPMECTGSIQVGGKIFYDWRDHGKIISYDQALAVSCNIAFAKMALAVGFARTAAVFERFYFNAGGLKDLFLDFKTGSLKRRRMDDFQFVKLSVGLSNNNEKSSAAGKSIAITTLHSALISAFVAQNGSIYSPFLIKNIKNVLHLGFYNHPVKIINAGKDDRVFQKVKQAMMTVVGSEAGTGRRAKVDFVDIAAKTGTGGEQRTGYDAILTGFFPAEKPHYAFAFILQGAGKAEKEGALFLKDFLISFYKRGR